MAQANLVSRYTRPSTTSLPFVYEALHHLQEPAHLRWHALAWPELQAAREEHCRVVLTGLKQAG